MLVGLSGLEPPTSRLSGVRSNRLSYKPISFYAGCSSLSASLLDTISAIHVFPDSISVIRFCGLPFTAPCVLPHSSARSPAGGDKRVRTADPLLAKQVLSQLSYTPVLFFTFEDLVSKTLKIKQRSHSLLPIT